MDVQLPVRIRRQPDYTTCGPTSLHAVYSYFGDDISLEQVIDEVRKLEGGGTLSPHLALHALRRGYRAEMWAFSPKHWDPTWFQQPGADLAALIRQRATARGLLDDPRYGPALESVEEYFRWGGKLYWRDLTPQLIGGLIGRGIPILTGTNGTYLYQCARETAEGPDPIRGEPFGHFVVLAGYCSRDRTVSIADPLRDNPLTATSYYRAKVYRVIGAIFLGAATDDAAFFTIRPKGWKRPRAVPTGAAG